MKSNSTNKLQTFLDEMSHFDPDNMQMGAKAVCELVLSGELHLQQQANQPTANLIRQAFIKQMQSQNYNVHAHAIRCIADMVPKLPQNQVEMIFRKIINSIANIALDQKKRQIYGICAGTVIHQAADQYGQKLSDLFVQSIKQLMKSKGEKLQIQVILINVISEFIRKWPRVSSKAALSQKFDTNELVKYLLENVQHRNKLEIIKKSETALGKVAIIMTNEHFQTLFHNSQFGLLKYLSKNTLITTTESMKHLRNGLLCLSNILKTHNHEIRQWSVEICKILLEIINRYKKYDNFDQIDITCDILDSTVVCLSYLLKSYSRELTTQFMNPHKNSLNTSSNPLNEFVQQMINFDLEGQMSYISLQGSLNNAGMSNQSQQYDNDYGDEDGNGGYDDYYEDQQQNIDEKGWKVRRAIIFYITVLIKKDKSFKQKINTQNTNSNLINLLSAKLIESNSMVCEMAFQTFNNLIENISTMGNTAVVGADNSEVPTNMMRVKSNEEQMAFRLIKELNDKVRIIFQSSNKFSDALKVEGGKIIYRLVQLFKETLTRDHKLTDEVFATLEKQLHSGQIVENKNYVMLALRQLITNTRPFNQSYQNLLKQVIKTLQASTSNIKLIATSFKTLKTFIRVFPQQVLKCNNPPFGQVLNQIKRRLNEHDADRVVKYSAVKCLGPIFALLINNLQTKDLNDLLSALNSKLNFEIDKGYILDQINQIPSQDGVYKIQKPNVPTFQQTLTQISNNLGTSNAQLNYKVIESVNLLLHLLKDDLNTKTIQNILQKSKPIFSEHKVPSFISLVIEKYPKLVKPYSESIIKSTNINVITELISHKIVSQAETIKVLKGIDRDQNQRNISEILMKIGLTEVQLKKQIDESRWGMVCLGAIGYFGDQKGGDTDKFLIEMIQSPNKNEEFKLQAASALGNVMTRNQQKLIPEVIAVAQKSQNFYNFIYAIKEYLNFKTISTTISNNEIDPKLTQWLFQKSQNNFQSESIYHLISECIGKIAFLSNSEISSTILKMGHSNVENHRFVVANSLRFYFEGRQVSMEDEALSEYIKLISNFCEINISIVDLIGDKQPNVRCSATKSLNSMVAGGNANVSLLKNNLNSTPVSDKFWNNLKNNLQIDKQLIIQVDYGVSKEKKDLGRPLRLESFNLLKYLLKYVSIESQMIDDLILISLGSLNLETNPDLVIKRLSTVRTLCEMDFTQFISHITLFVQKISVEEGILKSYQKTVADDERNEIYLKGVLKEVVLIGKMAEKENIDQIKGYVTTLKGNERFGKILESDELKNLGNSANNNMGLEY